MTAETGGPDKRRATDDPLSNSLLPRMRRSPRRGSRNLVFPNQSQAISATQSGSSAAESSGRRYSFSITRLLRHPP